MKPLVVVDEEEGASMILMGDGRERTGRRRWTLLLVGELTTFGTELRLCPREKRRPSTENQLNSCHPYCGPLWKETPETSC